MLDMDAEVSRIYELANLNPEMPPSEWTMAEILLGRHAIKYQTNLPWKAEYNRGLRKIFIRKSLVGAARRFAIFHELGEALCHELEYQGPDREQVAHGLGVRLMIPREAWKAAVKKTGGDIWRLALHFRTTETIVALRRAEITGLPTAIVAPGFIMIRGEKYMFGQTEKQIRALAEGRAKADCIEVRPLRDSPRMMLVGS